MRSRVARGGIARGVRAHCARERSPGSGRGAGARKPRWGLGLGAMGHPVRGLGLGAMGRGAWREGNGVEINGRWMPK